ncbi:MAG: DUF4388 domain-containing protein [Acidobacteriota bacterium]
MAFQGSLKELPLPDIVQLVSASGKTGQFTLSRTGSSGVIFLKNGQIVHAELGELSGEEAIYALAIWNQGEFLFTPAVEAPGQTITKSNTNLLMEAARRIDEWRVLSKKIASVDLVPELQRRENRHEQITLNPQEWLLVTKINGRDTIAGIARTLNQSAFDVAKVLYGLITAELVVLKRELDLGGERPVEELVVLAARIRDAAEASLGESAQKSIDRYYREAVDHLQNGEGPSALSTLAHELEKTTALLRGSAASDQLRAQIAELTSRSVATAHD